MKTIELLSKISNLIASSGKTAEEWAKITKLPVAKIYELRNNRPKSIRLNDLMLLLDNMNVGIDELVCNEFNGVMEPKVDYKKSDEDVNYLLIYNNFLQNVVKEQLSIIKSCRYEISNGTADADSNNNSNEPGAR